MAVYEKIPQIFQEYLEEIAPAEGKLNLGKYLMGSAAASPTDACQQRFVDRLEAAVQETMELDGGAALDSLSYILSQADLLRGRRMAFWMALAVHRLALPLVDRIEPGEAGELYQWYGRTYTRRDRMPPQEQMLKALKKRSGQR